MKLNHLLPYLGALGYTVEHYPERWEDVGDAENGPKIAGGPAYDEWMNGNHVFIVCEGKIVDSFTEPTYFDDIPF